MKKILTLITFTLFLLNNVNAQKMYVWCPKPLNPVADTEQLSGIKVNVLVKDSRLLSGKIKNKCTSEQLVNSLFKLIKAKYPSATISKISSKKNQSENCQVLIEINITAYYATFTSPMWYAQVDYSLKINDYRGEETITHNTDIHKEKKFFNMGGFKTAQNNLNKSYIEANTVLLDFIADKLNN